MSIAHKVPGMWSWKPHKQSVVITIIKFADELIVTAQQQNSQKCSWVETKQSLGTTPTHHHHHHLNSKLHDIEELEQYSENISYSSICRDRNF